MNSELEILKKEHGENSEEVEKYIEDVMEPH